MPARMHRKQSKRVQCRMKYKRIKKVAEHKRKLRREQKKNPIKRKPKDPGVPNSLPFKDEILKEAEVRKQRAKDLRAAQKASRLKQQMENRRLEDFVYKAVMKGTEFESNIIEYKENEVNSENLKSYNKDFKKVVEASDVILQLQKSKMVKKRFKQMKKRRKKLDKEANSVAEAIKSLSFD